ncbi:hypothetical protein SO802_025974 [Lithocarpus litseifolius]|uniref:Uncharacterized protein n=1 Tax=Lithocarpus litseifolius TaxID=425828 RepID=A0AAW2C1M0_9ROSI
MNCRYGVSVRPLLLLDGFLEVEVLKSLIPSEVHSLGGFAAEARLCSAESSLFCPFQTERMFSFQSLTSHVSCGPPPSS